MIPTLFFVSAAIECERITDQMHHDYYISLITSVTTTMAEDSGCRRISASQHRLRCSRQSYIAKTL